MIGTSKILAVMLVCVLVLVGATTTQAGTLAGNALAYNDGNGPLAGAWTGTSPFVSGNGALVGTVDWAVFTSSTFNTLFAGGGYVAPANQLVYAHQIFTTGPLIGASGMDITLAGNPAGNSGSFSTLVPPVNGVPASFTFADPSIATFVLTQETSATTPSDGLVYSSPNRPQLTGIPFIVDGGNSANGDLPIGVPGTNPIPEPASGLLALMASVFCLGLRRAWRG